MLATTSSLSLSCARVRSRKLPEWLKEGVVLIVHTPTDVAEAWIAGMQHCADHFIDYAFTSTAAPAAG